MSEICFIHTDQLRLGGPVTGLAYTPDWLRQRAADSVRHAVRNMIETAVSHRADFVLISGAMVSDPTDAEAAAVWLQTQLEPLRRRGIRVVATAEATRDLASLNRLCDIVLRRNEVLRATRRDTGSVDLSSSVTTDNATSDLIISIGQSAPSSSYGNLWYHVVPAVRSSVETEAVSNDRRLSASAGALQALNSSETGESGCLVVHADRSSQRLRAVFAATDALRFVTEQVHFNHTVSVESLTDELLRTSQTIRRSDSRTVVVNWVIDGVIANDSDQVSRLEEQALLTRLREALQAGHKGVWPQSLKFSGQATLQLTGLNGAAVEELTEVATGHVQMIETDHLIERRSVLQSGRGIDAAYLAGLTNLSRSA